MKIDAFDIVDDAPNMSETRAIAMLKPWIDVGRVGTLVLDSLGQHLGSRELGRLARPGRFFDFTRDRPKTSLVDGKRILTKPNSRVHYAHDDRSGRDYLFLYLREPHMFGEDYVDAIVALLKHFNVSEFCRIGGMYDAVPHTRPLEVTGSLTDGDIERVGDLVSIGGNSYEGPTSIVTIDSEILDHMNITSSSLMLHVPQYVTLDEDYMGASRLMQVLCALYDFPVSFSDRARGEQQYSQITKAVEQNPEVTELIRQLEHQYDTLKTNGGHEVESGYKEPVMPPEIEDFLRELENGATGRGD